MRLGTTVASHALPRATPPGSRRGGGNSRTRPAGSILLVALVLVFLILIGLGTVFFLVREDRHATVHIVKGVRATAIAEGIQAYVTAAVHSKPWSERFYYKAVQTIPFGDPAGTVPDVSYTFNDGDPLFINLVDEKDRPYVGFVGIIKDLDAISKRYRLWLELTYMGHTMTFSWDKKYSEDLLGALNHNPDTLSKAMGQEDGIEGATGVASGKTALDELIDSIKDEAQDPSKETSIAGMIDRLKTYRRQEPIRLTRPSIKLGPFVESVVK